MYVETPLTACVKQFEDNFKLMYMFEALLSRGAIVKDYLLATETIRNDFVNIACESFKEDKLVNFLLLLFFLFVQLINLKFYLNINLNFF